MQIIVFLDLDDTIFQTLPKCPAGETVIPAARARDGSPLSYMTARQKHLLDWLLASATVIPTTARNADAFRRVDLPFQGMAILNFGGVILRQDGKLDPEWDKHIRPQVQARTAELEQLQTSIATFIDEQRLGARARLIVDFGMPLYVVVKHPAGRLDALERIRDELLPGLDLPEFFVHSNHNNLSIVPRCLGKEKAVCHVLENHFAGEQVLSVGMGDSLSDIPYLQMCDFSLLPGNSQLARSLEKT